MTTKPHVKLVDYINEKLEQIQYYKNNVDTVAVLDYIKEEVLRCHEARVATERKLVETEAVLMKIKAEVGDLRQECAHLSQHQSAIRLHELEIENEALRRELRDTMENRQALAELGMYEPAMRRLRVV